MLRKRLTDWGLKEIEPRSKVYEVMDSDVRGFGIRVLTSGRLSFILFRRWPGSKHPSRRSLGSYPEVSLANARETAREWNSLARKGIDPARKQPSDIPDTVDALAEAFIARHVKRKNKPKTAAETERLLRKNVLPHWKGKKLENLRKRDVLDLLDKFDGHKVTGNRTFAAVRKMLSWAIERDIIDLSPCHGVKAPAAETSRERVLSDNELKAVLSAVERLHEPFKSYMKILTLTLQRRDEVGGMRWTELDLKTGLWKLPSERTKNKRAHTVPLPPVAISILDSMPRYAGCDYVFTCDGHRKIAAYHEVKKYLDALIGKDIKEHWTLHDLRRTGASKMPNLKVSLEVTEKLLNHVSGSFKGVVGIYQRHDYLPEMREALEKWADFLCGLGEGSLLR